MESVDEAAVVEAEDAVGIAEVTAVVTEVVTEADHIAVDFSVALEEPPVLEALDVMRKVPITVTKGKLKP